MPEAAKTTPGKVLARAGLLVLLLLLISLAAIWIELIVSIPKWTVFNPKDPSVLLGSQHGVTNNGVQPVRSKAWLSTWFSQPPARFHRFRIFEKLASDGTTPEFEVSTSKTMPSTFRDRFRSHSIDFSWHFSGSSTMVPMTVTRYGFIEYSLSSAPLVRGEIIRSEVATQTLLVQALQAHWASDAGTAPPKDVSDALSLDASSRVFQAGTSLHVAGVLHNTFILVFPLVAALMLVRLWPFAIRRLRVRNPWDIFPVPGKCIVCSYDLSEVPPSEVPIKCPECGTILPIPRVERTG